MHSSRLAQGLPITTIILAILGLVVLIVLFTVTTGRLGLFTRATAECPGECVDAFRTVSGSDVPASGYRVNGCDSLLERKMTGNYIAAGQSPSQKPEEVVKCGSCCVRVS
jgi:hypothetical protein